MKHWPLPNNGCPEAFLENDVNHLKHLLLGDHTSWPRVLLVLRLYDLRLKIRNSLKYKQDGSIGGECSWLSKRISDVNGEIPSSQQSLHQNKQYAELPICSLQFGILSTRLCDFPLHQERDPMLAFLLTNKMSRSNYMILGLSWLCGSPSLSWGRWVARDQRPLTPEVERGGATTGDWRITPRLDIAETNAEAFQDENQGGLRLSREDTRRERWTWPKPWHFLHLGVKH